MTKKYNNKNLMYNDKNAIFFDASELENTMYNTRTSERKKRQSKRNYKVSIWRRKGSITSS
jgi:hypothetical protein